MVSHMYDHAQEHVHNKDVDLLDDTVKIILLKDTYTPAKATHEFVSDLTPASNEVSGGNYSRYTLANKTFAPSGSEPNLYMMFDNTVDPTWANASWTCRYAVVADCQSGSDATSPVLAYCDFGENKTVTSDTFTLQIDTNGIFRYWVK